jgi:adenosylcobinamide kinase / adenosylcobinamide-phosphate guanylyltransferase
MQDLTASTRSLLVLGAARSGKSRYAQRLAEASRLKPVLIATAEAHDSEMAGRIARHTGFKHEALPLADHGHDLKAFDCRRSREQVLNPRVGFISRLSTP